MTRNGPPGPIPPAPERPRGTDEVTTVRPAKPTEPPTVSAPAPPPANGNAELDVRLTALELKPGDVLLVEIEGGEHECARAAALLERALIDAGFADIDDIRSPLTVPVVVMPARLAAKVSVLRPDLVPEPCPACGTVGALTCVCGRGPRP